MTPATAAAPMPPEESTRRLALLIDADNAQPSVIEALLAEVARFGEATVRRIYGDFTSPGSAGWKKCLNRCSIKPIQQFAYTTGKNATDGTMIIDAMDLLYTRRFDGFCLVTSDSDFTGLAVRLREEGLQVFGFGEQKTPEAFRNACHRFIFTEVLRPAPPPSPSPVRRASSRTTCATTARCRSTPPPLPNRVTGSRRSIRHLFLAAFSFRPWSSPLTRRAGRTWAPSAATCARSSRTSIRGSTVSGSSPTSYADARTCSWSRSDHRPREATGPCTSRPTQKADTVCRRSRAPSFEPASGHWRGRAGSPGSTIPPRPCCRPSASLRRTAAAGGPGRWPCCGRGGDEREAPELEIPAPY